MSPLCDVRTANSGRICGQGATLRCKNPLLNLINFTQGHFMKIELLVANVTAVRSPDRAECAILGVVLAGRFLANPGRICIVVGEPLCGAGSPCEL